MDPVSIPVLAAVLLTFLVAFRRRVPFVMFIAIVNFLIFLYMITVVVLVLDGNVRPFYDDLALRPGTVTEGGAYTLVTHFFLHGGLLHILGNTIFLVFFGMPLEHRIGPRKFAVIYLTAGIVAGLLDTAASFGIFHDEHIYRVGASGAIFGIMGAYLALYPNDRILMPLILIIEAPVWAGVLVYGAFETWLVMVNPADGIGHMAHVGGLAAGLVLGPLIVGRSAARKVIRTADLGPIAKGGRARELLERIENEDIPDITEAWLDQLAEVSKCPRCGSGIVKAGDRMICSKCEWGLKFRHREKRRRKNPFS